MNKLCCLTLLTALAFAPALPAADDSSELEALLEGLPVEEVEVENQQAVEPEPQEAIVIDGEDIGSAPADSDNPLTVIRRQMREVKQRISEGNTAEETQFLQRQIVGDLDKLLDQLNKQCNCQNPSQQQQPKPGGAGKPSGGNEPGQASNRPNAQGSEEGTREAEEATETAADPRAVAREAWGHLPKRLREQVQAAAFERFLPQYEAVIEAYYQRLAEEDTP